MDRKDMIIKKLTDALRMSDGVCDYCVGCQALGKNSYDDCLENENRAKDFVLATDGIELEAERETRHHDCPFCGKQWREYCEDSLPDYCPKCGDKLEAWGAMA